MCQYGKSDKGFAPVILAVIIKILKNGLQCVKIFTIQA